MMNGLRRKFTTAAQTGFKSSRLPNGVRVASINNQSAPFAAVGVLLKTGVLTASQYPNPKATAASFILEKLTFKVLD